MPHHKQVKFEISLSQIQGFLTRLGLPVLRQQQVRQVVLVQLQHVAGHAEGVLAAVAVQDGEQLVDAARREPRVRVAAVDRVRLARACVRQGLGSEGLGSLAHDLEGFSGAHW